MNVQLDFLSELETACDNKKPDLCEQQKQDAFIENSIYNEDDEFEDDEENEFNENRDENGWYICPNCGRKVANPVESGLCYECDYIHKNPDAKKQYCENCVWFRYHSTYDKNDFTECSCRKHLEAKNQYSYCYECKDYKKCSTAEELDTKYKGLAIYHANKPMIKCNECGKEYRSLIKGRICLTCFDKHQKKADEIRRGFIAEGYKEVEPGDYKYANSETHGWIDERHMDAFESRKGQRYFTIDEINLTWKFFFFKDKR